MITSAENRSWPGAIAIDEPSQLTVLPAPSVVRPCKIATIEARHAEAIGKTSAIVTQIVIRSVTKVFL